MSVIHFLSSELPSNANAPSAQRFSEIILFRTKTSAFFLCSLQAAERVWFEEKNEYAIIIIRLYNGNAS